MKTDKPKPPPNPATSPINPYLDLLLPKDWAKYVKEMLP